MTRSTRRPTGALRLPGALLLAMICTSLGAPAAHAEIFASPELRPDLLPSGSEADVVTVSFEDLPAGSTLDRQLRFSGVTFRPLGSAALRIEELPGSSRKAATVAGTALDILLTRQRASVAIRLGGVPAGTTRRLRLEAHDAGDELLESAEVEVYPAADGTGWVGVSRRDVDLSRLRLTPLGDARLSLRELRVEPSLESWPIEPYRDLLRAESAERQERLDALAELQNFPSTRSSRLLQEVALSQAEERVRERAVHALVQIHDPGAIPALVRLGTEHPTGTLHLAARNAVDRLRRSFPLADPPRVELRRVPWSGPGHAIEVEARVVSPVDRDNVRVRIGRSEGLVPVRTAGAPGVWKGALRAGEPVRLRARFRTADEEVRRRPLELPVTVRIQLDPVDGTTYRFGAALDLGSEPGREAR